MHHPYVILTLMLLAVFLSFTWTPEGALRVLGALNMWRVSEFVVIGSKYQNTTVFRSMAPWVPEFIQRQAVAINYTLLKSPRYRNFLFACNLICAVLAALNPSFLSALLQVFSCATLSFFLYSTTGWHSTFSVLYLTTGLVLPPGWTRGIVLLTVVAHSYFSPGIIKVVVGGHGWISAETLFETLDAYKDIAKSRYLWEMIRKSSTLSVFLNIATLVFECVIVPMILVVEPYCAMYSVSTGKTEGCGVLAYYKYFVIVAVAAFHTGIYLSVGMNFLLQMFVVIFGIVIASHDLTVDSTASRMTIMIGGSIILGLVKSTWYGLESWPFNAISIFPFNASQNRIMRAAFINSDFRLVLVPESIQDNAVSGQQIDESILLSHDLIRMACSMDNGLCSVYTPGFQGALDLEDFVLSPVASTKTTHKILRKLNIWLSRDRPYRSSLSGTALIRSGAMILKQEEKTRRGQTVDVEPLQTMRTSYAKKCKRRGTIILF